MDQEELKPQPAQDIPQEQQGEAALQDVASQGKAPQASALEQEVGSLRSQLEEAEREKRQFKELAQRVQADFINYRKRTEQERDELEKNANARLIMRLLPIIDDLALALGHIKESEEAPWVEGVKLIYRKLLALLESEGVQPIQAQGKSFDPWEHESLLYQDTQEVDPGTVIAVVRGGFKLHGRVIRPAQVVVARQPEPAPEPAPREPSPEGEG
jgi:molecular chaperone GrpE